MSSSPSRLILDGKVFETDRCAEKTTSAKGEEIDAWYSGKARRHGGNVQAVMRPDGLPLWAGPAEPGSVHDITAALEDRVKERFPQIFRLTIHPEPVEES